MRKIVEFVKLLLFVALDYFDWETLVDSEPIGLSINTILTRPLSRVCEKHPIAHL